MSSVDHPKHYNDNPSGVEAITVCEHLNFNRGNAMKYLWRAGSKDPAREIEDLEKARWYLDREIARMKSGGAKVPIVFDNLPEDPLPEYIEPALVTEIVRA